MKKLIAFITIIWVQNTYAQVTSLSCPDNNHPHAIDMGFSSMTKWSCCNLGAKKPEESGGYYAWGENKEKKTYTSANYTEYNDYGNPIVAESKNAADRWERGPFFDTAGKIWGEKWRMPTRLQVEELLYKCDFVRTSLNGTEGYLFTSKRNGNTIFIPCAGAREDKLMSETCLYLWTKTTKQWGFNFKNNPQIIPISLIMIGETSNLVETSPYYGLNIRPVWRVIPGIVLEEDKLKNTPQALAMQGEPSDVIWITYADEYPILTCPKDPWNEKIPEEAKEKGIKGHVLVSFIVEKDGSISGVKIIKGVDPLLDSEAIRLIEALPKCKPGKKGGKVVRIRLNRYIYFNQ